MTLLDLINYICLQMSRTDNDSKLACTQFVNARYKVIYDAYPWRDSEIISPVNTFSGPPPTELLSVIASGAQLSLIEFPTGMERIVKVGLVANQGGVRVLTDLRPSDSASLLETRPDVLLSSGTPEFYEELNTSSGRFIRIYPSLIDPTNFQFLIVGKKTCNNLVNSGDLPILRNIDNVLIAYGLADMLKRDRHYAKAAQQLQEADKLLQEAIALEQQQSNAPRAARPLSVTGGTLSELTDAVASRLGLWDAASGNKIVEALRRNYQELYDRELWTESVMVLSMQAQGQVLIIPPYIDHVEVVCNSANFPIEFAEVEYLFRTNPAIFDSNGSPFSASILPPVGVAVLPEAAEQLSLVSDNPNDNFYVSVYGESNGLVFEESVNVTNGATGFTANEYDVPLRISKPTSLGTLTVSGASSLIKYGDIPANMSSVQYQRVWVQPQDSTSFNGDYFVVGKRKLQQLVNTVDAITVPRGCESALINLSCADLAPDAATRAEFRQLAEAQIQTLITRETNQQVRRTTITPYTERSCDGYDGWGWMRD